MTPYLNKVPFEHLIVDDYYNEEDLAGIWREIETLHPLLLAPEFTQPAIQDGEVLKHNKGLYLDEYYRQREDSYILGAGRKLFSDEVIGAAAQAHMFYSGVKYTNFDATLLSYYGESSYYKPHRDSYVFTAVTMLSKQPQGFSGGELVFPDYAHAVPFVNNRLILFPSFFLHAVQPVHMLNDEPMAGRYSITQFCTMSM